MMRNQGAENVITFIMDEEGELQQILSYAFDGRQQLQEKVL